MLRRLLRFLFGPRTPARLLTEDRDDCRLAVAADLPDGNDGTFETYGTSSSSDAGQVESSEEADCLDASRFAPISVTDRQASTGLSDWRCAKVDSRGEIPSEDLPRVQWIDRAMVRMGLISEEELAEIHGVEKQIAATQVGESGSPEVAADAVAESREERQQRKALKKAEAEQRRKIRLDQIATRRATDIVFLGRGVSRGLADRRSDLVRLQEAGLPVLASPADVAAAMGITISKLRWLAFHSEAPTRVHYVSFEIAKKNGGMRRLSAPHQQLAAAQNWILTSILNLIPVHDCAHGFVRQHSVLTNAASHVGSAVVINADLSDFFPTITFARVDGLFRQIGYSPAVSTILALLCTECPRQAVQFENTTYYAATGPRVLPQGACTSPAISNLIARKLDRRMTAMAQKLGWQYTRYADDLTWSIQEMPSPPVGYVLARIRHIAEDEGFQLNHAKTRVQRRSQQQSVTGVVVNDRMSVSRATLRRVRAILHNAGRTGLAAQNRDQHPHFESWLVGMIGWISMVNPEQGQKLRVQLEQVRSR